MSERPATSAATRRLLGGGLVAVALWWSATGLEVDWSRVTQNAARNTRRILADMWPPDWDAGFRRQTLEALLETIQISILATAIGFVLALPVAVLAARNLMPRVVAVPFRVLAAAIRVPPSLLWAIFMVMVLGFGAAAGVAAMGIYSAGYLAKLQYEAFEGLPRDSLDAVRAMGAGRFQVAWHVVLPEAQNQLRSQLLFMFEYNVRASSIIGVVGAGGIGRLLSIYLDFFQYDRVLAILVLMLLTVVVIDALSAVVRRRFLDAEERAAPRWRDVFLGIGRGP